MLHTVRMSIRRWRPAHGTQTPLLERLGKLLPCEVLLSLRPARYLLEAAKQWMPASFVRRLASNVGVVREMLSDFDASIAVITLFSSRILIVCLAAVRHRATLFVVVNYNGFANHLLELIVIFDILLSTPLDEFLQRHRLRHLSSLAPFERT